MHNQAAPGKYDPGFKKSIFNRYAPMHGKLVISPAWRELTPSAKDVHIIFLLKREWIKPKGKKKVEYINTGLEFPYSEAKSLLGMSSSTFTECIQLQVKVGLLDITRRGNPYRRETSVYAISNRWEKYGTPGFQKVEYKKISTPAGFDAPEKREQKNLRCGNP